MNLHFRTFAALRNNGLGFSAAAEMVLEGQLASAVCSEPFNVEGRVALGFTEHIHIPNIQQANQMP